MVIAYCACYCWSVPTCGWCHRLAYFVFCGGSVIIIAIGYEVVFQSGPLGICGYVPALWCKFFVWCVFIIVVNTHNRIPIIESWLCWVVIIITPSACGEICPFCCICNLRNLDSISICYNFSVFYRPVLSTIVYPLKSIPILVSSCSIVCNDLITQNLIIWGMFFNAF